MKLQTPLHRIKKARREAQLQKIVAGLLTQQSLDDALLRSLTVTRVELNDSRSVCYVLFYSPAGEADFKEKLGQLILYKPSLRKAIGDELQGRYVPDVVFKYDANLTKQLALEALIDKVTADDANTQ
jgi:ribosome-binding factor A